MSYLAAICNSIHTHPSTDRSINRSINRRGTINWFYYFISTGEGRAAAAAGQGPPAAGRHGGGHREEHRPGKDQRRGMIQHSTAQAG